MKKLVLKKQKLQASKFCDRKKYFNKKIDTISKKLIKKSFQSIEIGKIAFYNQLEMPLGKLMIIHLK